MASARRLFFVEDRAQKELRKRDMMIHTALWSQKVHKSNDNPKSLRRLDSIIVF